MTRSEDERAIDAVVHAFFQAFGNKGGVRPDLDALRALFLAEGVIIKTCGDAPTIYDLRSFIEPREKLLTSGELVDFSEEELWGRTDLFGNIAQRFCVYRKSGLLSGQRFEARGTKSIQLVKTPAGWKISAVAWDDEREGLSVPPAQDVTRSSL
jgi:hypothetical protein